MAVGDLKDFDGGVPELVRWIAEHGGVDDEQEIWGRLTERGFSGKSAVTRKAPAIWWMLDLISGRPEARHHRVIRIDEPQLLSVLDLQPRDGATYSLAEVMEHYGELEEQIDQASRQFSADENRATRFQRRLLRLATNISRITQLRDVFSTLEFDASRPHTGLVQIMLYKDVLERMGQVSDSSLVMAVPRPGETPDGTWEPLALASIKQGMLQYAASHGITTVDALVTALIDQAPQELVLGQLQEVTSRLQAGVTDEMTLNQLAARILPTLKQEDFVLKEALTCIASSSSSDPAEIYAQLSESRRERLFNLAAADVLLKLREHVSPKARQAVNDVFQSQQVNRESVTGLLRTHTREIAEQLFSRPSFRRGPGTTSRNSTTPRCRTLRLWHRCRSPALMSRDPTSKPGSTTRHPPTTAQRYI